VAVCRQDEREAERKVLSITTHRGGSTSLDGWMARQGAPIDVVVMESSGHYCFNLASHLRRQGIRLRW
jgi:transposase